MELRELITLEEMTDQLDVIRCLYPDFTESSYYSLLKEMIPHNYRQLAVFEQGHCVAVCGFWINHKLWCGKYLELDNVVVHPDYRSKGVGKIVVEYLKKKALDSGCRMLALDSYTDNFKAHKFFYNEGFVPRGFHFIQLLQD